MRRPPSRSRRIKLRLSLTVAAIAAVAAAVVPYAITRTADTAAGAAQFSGTHHGHHSATVESHRQQPKSSPAPTPKACPNSPTKASTLWSSSLQPKVASSSTDSAATLGVMVVPNKSGQITGIAFWKGTGNDGVHTASLWTDSKRLASGTFQKETASGWQWLTLAHPVQVKAGQHVLATYRAPEGHFAYTPGAITPGGVCSGALRATDGTLWMSHGGSRHHSTSRTTNYFVNLRFVPTGGTAPDPTQSPTAKPTDPKPTVQPTTTPTHSQTPTATPKPTPKPTTSAPPSSSTSGWPNASNTGVPAGTKLTSSGPISVTKDGTVIDGKQVNGDITVRANNVTIENTKVLGGRIDLGWDQNGIMIKDVEVDGEGKSPSNERVPAIGSNGYTCIRCNVHGWNSGFDVRNNVTIEDSWAHDIGPASSTHKTALGSNGANHVVVRHNVLSCEVSGCSAAIAFYGDFTPVSNVVVDDNLFNTEGSYCSYEGTLSGKAYPVATNITWTNNHYGQVEHPTCGIYGPATGWGSGGGNVWSGNVWDGSNKPIAAS
jgi:hypothetical protein